MNQLENVISKLVQRCKRQTHIYVYWTDWETPPGITCESKLCGVCVLCVCLFFAQRARSF
jgi:hypothetical protein